MLQESQQTLSQKLEKSYFKTLNDGTLLYKPPFRKNTYIVPDMNTKNEIIKALVFRRSILMTLLGLSFSINIITINSSFSLISSIVIGIIGLFIIMDSTRKFTTKMKQYNSK